MDRVESPPAADDIATHRRTRSNWLQWIILSLGAALFSCGAALVAWSFGEDRQDLWNIGAPMALAGQAAFLIGLVLQLDIIWQESKQTGRRLDELDQRVSPLAEFDNQPAIAPIDERIRGYGVRQPQTRNRCSKSSKDNWTEWRRV